VLRKAHVSELAAPPVHEECPLTERVGSGAGSGPGTGLPAPNGRLGPVDGRRTSAEVGLGVERGDERTDDRDVG